jgi:transposase
MAALDAQSVTVPAEAATGRVIAELATELDRVLARRGALAGEIEETFLAHPFGELLSTLPGIGPRTGSRILAETGDGTRFADGARLASYAGLAPVTRQSGKSVNGESLSRRGNHRLKNAMFLAAFASLRDPASKAFYDRKRTEGKRHNPPSSAWPAAAATSSWPCSAPASPTSPPGPHQTCPARPEHQPGQPPEPA